MATTLPNTGAIIPAMTEAPDQAVNNAAFSTIDTAVGAHLAESASDDVHRLLSDGKIIEESGSNENGRYIKFSDGTQICTIDSIIMNYTSSSSLAETWTFPASFIDGAEFYYAQMIHQIHTAIFV